MKIEPDKIKKYWPVALLLLAASVVSATSGLVGGASKLVGLVWSNHFDEKVCNSHQYCVGQNRSFYEFLLRHARNGKQFTLALDYESAIQWVGPCVAEETLSEGRALDDVAPVTEADEKEAMKLRSIDLPISQSDCSTAVVFQNFSVPPRGFAMDTSFYSVNGTFVSGGASGPIILLTKIK